MTAEVKGWKTWLALAAFGGFLYFLGKVGFHHEGNTWPLLPQDEQTWPMFLIILFIAIVLVLLAFRWLEPKDS